MKEEELREKSLEEKYHIFISEEQPLRSIYNDVRFGKNHTFDLNTVFQGHYTIKKKIGIVMIEGEYYTSKEFNTELEDRERTLTNHLVKKYCGSSPLRERI